CGRFTNQYSWRELYELYSLTDQDMIPSNFQPRYNIAPTQSVPVVRLKNGGRDLVMMRWGLVPSFAKDLSGGAKSINARGETVADKPMFKSAFLRRRCLVPADGFYEWKKEGNAKQPYFITLRQKAPFAFAGLWEWWRPRDGSAEILTFTIITTAANALVAPLHDRMPVILAPDAWPLWLAEKPVSPGQLQGLLKAFAPEKMESWPVSTKVNKPENDDPGLVQKPG
ncbi:MAG TPA: SOS response-associated peptidase, partial [Rhizomicrobium sp.]|nr:SOS response-associated peptidase [Rhizomicrobium sp.]